MAADKKAEAKKAEAKAAEVAAVQPAVESLDLGMYSRIRDEGFYRSHVMEFSGALFDDIGPRLTGSPAMMRANEWTKAQLEAMGCANAHLESWGEFGMAWTQNGAGLELVKPSAGVMVGQATPWSPATNGTITAEVVAMSGPKSEADFAPYKGKLRGKVVLLGLGASDPKIDPDKVPEMKHYDAAKLAKIAEYPLDGDFSEQSMLPRNPQVFLSYGAQFGIKAKLDKFLKDEGAVAVLVPGGSGGVLHDDTNSSMGWFVFEAAQRQVTPEEVIASEAWNRMSRLLENKVPVTVRLHVDTTFGDEHAQGYNTIAEIPGTDPKLKDEVVMVGGHLDSWAAGTGATDNGAGAVAAMEAMRILKALNVKPRRTIRIALWSGEEQGMYGSLRYVQSHFATFHYDPNPQWSIFPDFIRAQNAAPTQKPEAAKLDAYFNMDNGTGKLLGIYAEGSVGIGSIFQQWMAPLADLGMTTVSARPTGSTDHSAFQEAGLPGFQFIQDPRDYDSRTHHTNLDVYDHLSEPDLKQAAVVEAIFLYNAAMRDAMLPRPGFDFDSGVPKPMTGLYPDAVKQ